MLRYGKVYIIPTRFGLVFFAGIVIMLLVGATYANNLVNLLAFFLLAITLVAMVQTHNNLKDIKLHVITHDSAFADSLMTFTVALENTSQETRFNIDVRFANLKHSRDLESSHPLIAKAVVRQKTIYEVKKRGQFSIEKVKVSTVYPVGLFYAWMWLKTDSTYIVYPKRDGLLNLPTTAWENGVALSQYQSKGGDDFNGHRRYVQGDSSHRIDWKAYARGRPLLVKEFNEGNPSALLFDYHRLSHLGTEEKISQLAKWIDQAKQARLTYALQLPHKLISAGDDLHHYERCLQELALLPKDAA